MTRTEQQRIEDLEAEWWQHYDIPDFPSFSRRIREIRYHELEAMEKASGVDTSIISRFETKNIIRQENFDKYLAALRNRSAAFLWLNSDQTDILKDLRDHFKHRHEREKEFEDVKFTDIKVAERPGDLQELVDELGREQRPAFIMDGLLFVHVFNRAVCHLFGLDLHPNPNRVRKHTAYFKNWYAWHVFGTKFNAASPVRLAHLSPRENFEHTMTLFFTHEYIRRYLPTWQMRCLLLRLHLLSSRNDLEFTDLWGRARTFTLSPKLDKLSRDIKFKFNEIGVRKPSLIKTEAMIRNGRPVTFNDGREARYILVAWAPVTLSGATNEAYLEMAADPENHMLYFAADFDDGTFHPNTWPEVKTKLGEGS